VPLPAPTHENILALCVVTFCLLSAWAAVWVAVRGLRRVRSRARAGKTTRSGQADQERGSGDLD